MDGHCGHFAHIRRTDTLDELSDLMTALAIRNEADAIQLLASLGVPTEVRRWRSSEPPTDGFPHTLVRRARSCFTHPCHTPARLWWQVRDDQQGQTPLQLAECFGSDAAVQALLAAGADPDAVDPGCPGQRPGDDEEDSSEEEGEEEEDSSEDEDEAE